MKVIGWIAVFIGIVNLLCGKFLPGLSFAIVGALILIFNKDKKQEENSSIHSGSNIQETLQDKHFQDTILAIKEVEKVLNTNFSCWDQNDVIETVESFKRWANNQECNLMDVKKNFMSTYLKTFGNDDINEIIHHLQSKESVEANMFNIKPRNTCAHYMVKWLSEYNSFLINQKQKEEEKQQVKKSSENMQVRNVMTAKALVEKEQSTIDFVNNPKTNRIFFTCGSKTGYVSPAVVAKIESVELEDLKYAECASVGTDNWIPCLFFNNRSSKAPNSTLKKTMGADILKQSTLTCNNPEDDDLPF